MSTITQKQLQEQIKTLKNIKPRKEWAVLLKAQILAPKHEILEVPVRQEKQLGFMDVISSVFFQRKLAYSFAAILFVVAGVLGYTKYAMPGDLLFPVKKIAEQSQAALTGQTGLQDNVVALNNRINDLAQVAQEGKTDNIPSAIDEVRTNAKDLVQNLKDNTASNSQAIKDIAVGLKTLADVPGTDLTATPEMQDLYKTVVQNQIADLEKTTLTDEQKITLSDAENLYSQDKYTDALEKLLLISK